MMKMKLFCAVAVAMFVSVLPACGQSPPAKQEPAKNSTSQYVVGAGEVLMPQGVFLLIRQGQKIGAIKFTNIEQGSKLGTGRASYESYFQDDGSRLFGLSNVHKRTGEINLKPLKGIGRLSLQPGKDKIKIGEWSFLTGYPGAIDMYPSWGEEKDYGYEFAPTSAKSLEEIDVSDRRLKWFRYNADTKVVLPVSELPK